MDIPMTETERKWASRQTSNITFRLSAYEKQQLKEIATAHGLSANSWLRRQIKLWHKPLLEGEAG